MEDVGWYCFAPMPTVGALDRTQYEDLKRLANEQSKLPQQDPSKRKRVRKRDPHHIPRPINCFLAYRLDKQKQIAERCSNHTMNHRDISKLVAKWWRQEPQYIKDLYIEKAKQAKREHLVKYPGYKYTPKKRKRTTNNGGGNDNNNNNNKTSAPVQSTTNSSALHISTSSSASPFSLTSMMQPPLLSSFTYSPWISNPYFFQSPYLDLWSTPQLTNTESPASQLSDTSFPEVPSLSSSTSTSSSSLSSSWQPPTIPDVTTCCDQPILWQDDQLLQNNNQHQQQQEPLQVLETQWTMPAANDINDTLFQGGDMTNNAMLPDLMLFP